MQQPMRPFEYLDTRIRHEVHEFSQESEKPDFSHLDNEQLLVQAMRGTTDSYRGGSWSELAIRIRDEPTRLSVVPLVAALFETTFAVSPVPSAVNAWLDGILLILDFVSDHTRTHLTVIDNYAHLNSGSLAEDIKSRPEEYIDHKSYTVRSSALLYLGNSSQSPRCLERLMNIVHDRFDVGCQISAVSHIGRIASKNESKSAIQLLATIVLDETMQTILRDTAYQSLHVALKTPVEQWPVMLDALGQYHFPESVNWDLVRHCQQGSSGIV